MHCLSNSVKAQNFSKMTTTSATKDYSVIHNYEHGKTDFWQLLNPEMQIIKTFRGKNAEIRAKNERRKLNVSTEVVEYMATNASDMAIRHLEAWKGIYSQISLKQLKTDLYVNHDPSLEIDEVEEHIGRGLNSDECDYVFESFNKAVIRIRG